MARTAKERRFFAYKHVSDDSFCDSTIPISDTDAGPFIEIKKYPLSIINLTINMV